MREIGRAFNQARKQHKSQAWLRVQRMLMANADMLIREGIFPPDKFFETCMRIDEHFAKADIGSDGGSALQAVEDFLNGKTQRQVN